MPRPKTVTLRWSRVPRETGLRAVGAGPRGWVLSWGPNRLASVHVMFKGFSRETDGWCFVACNDDLGIDLHNTSGTRGLGPDVVRAACVEHVLAALRAAHPDVRFKAPTRCPDADLYL